MRKQAAVEGKKQVAVEENLVLAILGCADCLLRKVSYLQFLSISMGGGSHTDWVVSI